MHMIDDLRWDVVLPREFSHPELLANPRVEKVLMNDVILGDDLSLPLSVNVPYGAWSQRAVMASRRKISVLVVVPPDEWHSMA